MTWVDIGHGVTIEIRALPGETRPAGVAYRHPNPDTGHQCEGWAPFNPENDPGGQWWDLVQLDPLTITPSLACRGCGHHGFITDGRWVPA